MERSRLQPAPLFACSVWRKTVWLGMTATTIGTKMPGFAQSPILLLTEFSGLFTKSSVLNRSDTAS